MLPRDIFTYEQRVELGYNEQDAAHACMPNGSLVGYSPRAAQPESHTVFFAALVNAVVEEWITAGFTTRETAA